MLLNSNKKNSWDIKCNWLKYHWLGCWRKQQNVHCRAGWTPKGLLPLFKLLHWQSGTCRKTRGVKAVHTLIGEFYSGTKFFFFFFVNIISGVRNPQTAERCFHFNTITLLSHHPITHHAHKLKRMTGSSHSHNVLLIQWKIEIDFLTFFAREFEKFEIPVCLTFTVNVCR